MSPTSEQLDDGHLLLTSVVYRKINTTTTYTEWQVLHLALHMIIVTKITITDKIRWTKEV